MEKGGFFAKHKLQRCCIHRMSEGEEKSHVSFMYYINASYKSLTSSHEELTFVRNVWKPYITCSVSSHGCFSVHSARTNFTVLKQLVVQKEYVMSCREI